MIWGAATAYNFHRYVLGQSHAHCQSDNLTERQKASKIDCAKLWFLSIKCKLCISATYKYRKTLSYMHSQVDLPCVYIHTHYLPSFFHYFLEITLLNICYVPTDVINGGLRENLFIISVWSSYFRANGSLRRYDEKNGKTTTKTNLLPKNRQPTTARQTIEAKQLLFDLM